MWSRLHQEKVRRRRVVLSTVRNLYVCKKYTTCTKKFDPSFFLVVFKMKFLTAWVAVQYHCRAVKRMHVSLSAHTDLTFPGASSLQQSSNFITIIHSVGKSCLLYLYCFSALAKDAQTVVCDPNSLDCPSVNGIIVQLFLWVCDLCLSFCNFEREDRFPFLGKQFS